jgi:hypothetical protein
MVARIVYPKMKTTLLLALLVFGLFVGAKCNDAHCNDNRNVCADAFGECFAGIGTHLELMCECVENYLVCLNNTQCDPLTFLR